MTWAVENLDQLVQVATLLSLIGAGTLLRKIVRKLGEITALPSTVDRLSNSVVTLSSRLEQMDKDVKEAISSKKHIAELITEMSFVKSVVAALSDAIDKMEKAKQ